jgi:hypothetical protein
MEPVDIEPGVSPLRPDKTLMSAFPGFQDEGKNGAGEIALWAAVGHSYVPKL